MKVKITRVTSWKDVLNAARFTQRKEPLDKEPSDEFKKKIIKAEHSPLRCLMFNIDFYDIPYYVSTHLVRHVHAQPFVSTSRPDVDKKQKPRNEQKKSDLVNMRLFLNAQEIINISKVRMCCKAEFETRGVRLETSIEQGVRITADDTTVNKTISELIENALKFAKSKAKITLTNENGSVKLTFENDTELQDSDLEQIFDRFTRLSNAEGKPGNGLGLSYVKDAVKANNGRMNAKVRDGVFTLTISL